ncbi:MAG: peptidoglycan DD-metalloendopeptidase family protein [Erysipelotrichales bacterium]|nr:peptidoglycan DD-metalloendopeptidase family protein [Erysipelotrichales bacterium]
MNDFIISFVRIHAMTSIMILVFLFTKKRITNVKKSSILLVWIPIIISLIIPLAIPIVLEIPVEGIELGYINYSQETLVRFIEDIRTESIVNYINSNITLEFPLTITLLVVYSFGVMWSLIKRMEKQLYIRSLINSSIIEDKLFKERVDLLCNTHSIKLDVMIIDLPHINACMFNSTIIINKNMSSMSDDDLCHILLHEYAHYKYKHQYIMNLLDLLKILYWFNPLISQMVKDINVDLECIADEYVQSAHKNFIPKKYVSLIIQIASNNTSEFVFGFSSMYHQIKERSVYLMQRRKRGTKKLSVVLMLVVAFITVVSRIDIISVNGIISTDSNVMLEDRYEEDDRNNTEEIIYEKEDGMYITTSATQINYLTGNMAANPNLDRKVANRDLYVLDVYTDKNAPVYSFTSGEVVFVGNGSFMMGQTVIIKAEDGTYYGYIHLAGQNGITTKLTVENTIIEKGVHVEAGQIIAYAGSSGAECHMGYGVVNFIKDDECTHLDLRDKYVFNEGIKVYGDMSPYNYGYAPNPEAWNHRYAFFDETDF